MAYNLNTSTVDEELEQEGFSIQDLDAKPSKDDDEDEEEVVKEGLEDEEVDGAEKKEATVEEEDEEDSDDDLKRLERMAEKVGIDEDMLNLSEEEESI